MCWLRKKRVTDGQGRKEWVHGEVVGGSSSMV